MTRYDVPAGGVVIDHSTSRDIDWTDRQAMTHQEASAALRGLSRTRLDRACERVAVAAPAVELVTAMVDVDPRLAIDQRGRCARVLLREEQP